VRVIIVGAGAVGGFIGARLALAGNQVTLVGRPWLVDAVRAQGLRLIEPRQERLVHHGLSAVAGVTEAATLGPFDLALLTVKTYDVVTAARQMREVGLGHPPVVCLQNGIGSEGRLSQIFGSDRVIAASLTQPVSVPEPGVVRLVKERGGVALAPLEQETDVGRIAAALSEAGLKIRLYRDYRAVKWSKLPLNILGNTIPAILDMPPGEVYAHPGLLQVEVAAMRELTAVTRALGVRIVNLPGYPARPLMWALGHLPAPLLSPLLHRLVGGGRKGRVPSLMRGLTQERTVSEVTDLNGAVVRYGARAGVPTPVNRLLTETLEAIYAGGADAWSEWRHQPERLVEACKTPVATG
jgi:2-dehydropantoate 2-reductase